MIEQTTEMDRILLGNTRDLKEVRVSGQTLKVKSFHNNIKSMWII